MQVVELLLNGYNMDTSDEISYCLTLSSRFGHTDIVKLLLADGRSDPCTVHVDSYCLKYACANSHTEVVKLLFSDGRADPLVRDNKCLNISQKYDHTEEISLLLEDLNQKRLIY